MWYLRVEVFVGLCGVCIGLNVGFETSGDDDLTVVRIVGWGLAETLLLAELNSSIESIYVWMCVQEVIFVRKYCGVIRRVGNFKYPLIIVRHVEA